MRSDDQRKPEDVNNLDEMDLESQQEELLRQKKFRFAIRMIILGGLVLVGGILFVLGTIAMRLGGASDKEKAESPAPSAQVIEQNTSSLTAGSFDLTSYAKDTPLKLMNINNNFAYFSTQDNTFTLIYAVDLTTGKVTHIASFKTK